MTETPETAPLIGRIVLRQGAGPGARPLHFAPGLVTVLVGPNNSGKSLLLREIEDALAPESLIAAARQETSSRQPPGSQVMYARRRLMDAEQETLVLDQVRLRPSFETFARLAQRTLHVKVVPFQESSAMGVGDGPPAAGTESVFVNDSQSQMAQEAHRLLEVFDRKGSVPGLLAGVLVRVDGRKRFELVRNRERGDLHGPVDDENLLLRLVKDEPARSRLRAEVLRAFPGVHVVIDGTRGAELQFGVNPGPPPGPGVELGADAAAVAYHARTTPLARASDGVNAFVALVAALLGGPYDVMLVDEPEAYLPAPRQRQLGRLLTDLARERGGHVVVSTHSPSFLEGCLERDPGGLKVVRLTYDGTRGTARLLADEDLGRLAREPLLRNTAALEGLFRDTVVVTEDHNDRVVYQEVSRRLSDRAGNVPDPDVLFVSAENKSTLAHMVGPLRRLGVPAVVQGDLDLIHGVPPDGVGADDARYWTRDLPRTLQAAGVSDDDVVRLVDDARRVVGAYRARGVKRGEIKKKGRAFLDGDAQEALDRWLVELMTYGVFLVPVGELERWGLAGATKKGREWVEAAFESMGSDPDADGYAVAPDGVSADASAPAGNVWAFVAQMKVWGASPAAGLDAGDDVEPYVPVYRPELMALHNGHVAKETAELGVEVETAQAMSAPVGPRSVAVPEGGDWFAADPDRLAERDWLAQELKVLGTPGSVGLQRETE